jgi:kojibiose phosphorylase
MVMYRIKGLEEAKQKAKQLGYSGAFYPNESGENGYELNQFNMKNNIHINGSIIYGIYQYIERTADYTVLFQGGLDMLFECARFYLSYATLSENKKHYDFLNVRGIDDTHGEIDNEAYTNYIIKNSLDALIKCVAFAKQTDKVEATKYLKDMDYDNLLDEIRELRRKLYTKKENIEYLIEAFDNYFKLEDQDVPSGKKISFIKDKKISNIKDTTYMKDANVLVLEALFLDDFTPKVNQTNYEFYLRRSVNPEYLSRIMYIICACENGYPEDAYEMYQELADLGLDNEYLFKEGLNLGLLGGLYLGMIYGFAGVKHHVYLLEADYNSSKKIRRIEFKIRVVDNIANVKIKRNSVSVLWGDNDVVDEVDEKIGGEE